MTAKTAERTQTQTGESPVKLVGLRIDVDTWVGLERGVPSLLDLLSDLDVSASFFVALGPDSSGLALRGILTKRGFARRLIRLRGVYGVKTGLYGLILPSPKVGDGHPELLREIEKRGNEVGLHGWDHRRWQDLLPRLGIREIERDFELSARAYKNIFGKEPQFSASPGWVADSRSLAAQEIRRFRFASDVRGKSPFYPVVEGTVLKTVQLPVTLPTLDELIASGEERRLLGLELKRLDIYCAHAELEGRSRLGLFRDFIRRARGLGFTFCQLSQVCQELTKGRRTIPECETGKATIPGRAGEVAVQMQEANS